VTSEEECRSHRTPQDAKGPSPRTLYHTEKRNMEDIKESLARLEAKDEHLFQLQRMLGEAEKAAVRKEVTYQNRLACKKHEATQATADDRIAVFQREFEKSRPRPRKPSKRRRTI
jgi:hypothetical protein